MKTLIHSAISFIFSAGLASAMFASPKAVTPLVNEYGEQAGFGNPPEVVLPPPDVKEAKESHSRPGIGGLYVIPGAFQFSRQSFESIGSWRARTAAEARGNVIIGPLEVLDSGPTGPMTPEAIDAARDEVTAQVLERIKATDHEMKSLKDRSKDLDDQAKARFQAAANEVAQRRVALREDLRTVRKTDGEKWTEARAAVAVSFNAYVASLHRAEAVTRNVNS